VPLGHKAKQNAFCTGFECVVEFGTGFECVVEFGTGFKCVVEFGTGSKCVAEFLLRATSRPNTDTHTTSSLACQGKGGLC